MSRSLQFMLLLPIVCIVLVYLKPDLTEKSLIWLDDIRTDVLSKLMTVEEETKPKKTSGKTASKKKSKKSSEQSKTTEEPKPVSKGITKKPSKLKPNPKCVPEKELLFSKEELLEYTGKEGSPGLLLGYLGIVYDVSKGSKHYGPGGGYEFFAGRDATRAFTTGEFKEEGLVDDVEGLSVDVFGGIREWGEFYEKDYVRVGRVAGAYYDTEGCPTEKIEYLKKMYKAYEKDKEEQAQEFQAYPACNSEWSGNTGITRVWCSPQSGGASRGWTGVPRKIFTPKNENWRCACIKEDELDMDQPTIEYADPEENAKETAKRVKFEVYENCDPHSTECSFKS